MGHQPLWETAPTKFYQILVVVSEPATLVSLECFLWRDGDFPTYTDSGKLEEFRRWKISIVFDQNGASLAESVIHLKPLM